MTTSPSHSKDGPRFSTPPASTQPGAPSSGSVGPPSYISTHAMGRQGTAKLAGLLLADSRLPVGGYTVSGGLEPALLGGMAERDVPRFIAARLATVARVEAGTAVVAAAAVRHLVSTSTAPGRAGTRPEGGAVGAGAEQMTVATAGAGGAGGQAAAACPTAGGGAGRASAEDVAWAWAARTPVPAVREASIAQGRAMLRLVRRLRPDGPAAHWLSTLPRHLVARAVVLGAFAGELGLAGDEVARVVGYDDVQSVTAAALKLAPLDPLDAAAWTLEAAPALEELVATCGRVTTLADIPAHSTPQLEAWHAQHAASERKLFRV